MKGTRLIRIITMFLLIFPIGLNGTTIAVPIDDVPADVKSHVKSHKTENKKQVVYFRGPSQSKRVALTFDDGPDNDVTVRILDILKKEHVPATFFVVGRLVQKNPEVFKRIYQEGHVIASHSWNHPDFTKLSAKEIRYQLNKTSDLIQYLYGKTPQLFRLPYGLANKRVRKVIQKEGYTIIQWNLDTKDWKGPSSRRIVNVVSSHLESGSIILQHSAGSPKVLSNTVEALPKMIRLLKEQGYELVTVDELLGISAYK